MDIFIVNTNSIDNIPQNLLKSFQKKNYKNNQASRIHCLAYLMTDRILKEVYKIENREIYFRNKKPIVKNCKKQLSISHSKNYIALAFSDCNCGIDIEHIKPRNYKKISERMNFSCNNLEEFYREWTKFESDYKLGDIPKSHHQFQYEDYIITSSSTNNNETFEIYIQN